MIYREDSISGNVVSALKTRQRSVLGTHWGNAEVTMVEKN